MTPAQADPSVANFVTDVATQGPTDEGMRAADCWFAQHVLPARPACVDCTGPIPMWAQRSLSPVRGESAGIGEQISLGGRAVQGFALGAPPYDRSKAISVILGSAFVVPVGASVQVELPVDASLWQSPGVVTSDATVLTPSLPATTNGFVAVAPGTATLTGTPGDGEIGIVQVTVVAPKPEAETEDKKKRLSTSVMVGAGVVGIVVIGGVVYAVTRR